MAVPFGQRWRELARRLTQEIDALYLACRDPRVPWYAKALAALVLAYSVSPIDVIPDFVPVLGYLDDLILLPLGILAVRAMIPRDVMEDCRERARTAPAVSRLMSRAGLALVVGIWLVLAALAVWLALRFGYV